MDVEDIPPGLDFVRMLEAEVRRCDVFLAVIGPNWLRLTDSNGRRLLDRDNDYVRIEIEAGLRQHKLVIPVLVDGGEVPAAVDLPKSIRGLARRSGIKISHERFKSDVKDLVRILREALKDARSSQQQTEQLSLEELESARREAELSGRATWTGPGSSNGSGSARRFANLAAAQDTVVDVVDRSGEAQTVRPARPAKGETRVFDTVHRSTAPSQPTLPLHSVTIKMADGRSDYVSCMLLPGGVTALGGRGNESERPAHEAWVNRFSMMNSPVTRQLYADVTGAPAPGRGEPNAPVNMVSWVQALLVCNRLSAAAGLTPAYSLTDESGTLLRNDPRANAVARVEWHPNANGFRLPTEVEFEYALRGGTRGEFFWGDVASSPESYAWYGKSTDEPQPVKSKASNPWGLYDLAGNVWEWCWDAKIDGTAEPDKADAHIVAAPTSLHAPHRIVRGGSFVDPVPRLRSACRHWAHPARKLVNLGFRCVLSMGERRPPTR